MKKIFPILLLAVQLLPAQGTYYNSIDTAKSTFVSDLHNLIYSHTRITYDQYDETNIANFASRDTTGSQRAVNCVYTGFVYVYTPPFTWDVFSREHTWCQSWMPSRNASNYTSLPEYSDQHHIFPVHQNFANVRRSNHPLGKVKFPTYQYLDGKLGTDSLGRTVYEPRDAHKGDAARALLYMAVCYNGVGGYDWTFHFLNTITLPDSLSEAEQDVNLLIQWTKQDPPSDWEKSRNEYVYSIQGNRNPFVDHPEYVDVIDFNTLTKKSYSSTLATEPTNYVTNFTATLSGTSAIQLTWTEAAAGSQVPSGYLLLAKSTNSFTDPVDSVGYADDANLSDGNATVNLNYGGTSSYTFSGLNPNTAYYFRMYSVNGSGTASNYKTGGTIPSATSTTGSSTTHPVIYEIYGGGGNSGSTYTNDFIDLYNPGLSSVSVAGWSVQYASAAGSSWTATPLSGSIPGYGFYLIQEANGAAGTTPLPTPDATGTIAMGATAGKVALCNTTTALTGANPTGAAIIDFVGYGSTANGYEGTGPTPAPSNTASVARKNYGDDSNNNANDFLASTVSPKNSTVILPVELTSITATAEGGHITLSWHTATEVNNYGFDIEKNGGGSWNKIGFVAGQGTTNAPHSYSFVDANASGQVSYRLKQIDRDGKFEYSSTVQATAASIKTFGLDQNYPNPFNPSTSVCFAVKETQHVSLKIYNAVGQEVRTLFSGDAVANTLYSVSFDATGLASGMFFSVLQTATSHEVRKMTLLR